MKKLYKLGPVIIELRDFIFNREWPFAEWKLDAYAVESGTPDFAVSIQEGLLTMSDTPTVLEKSLYSRREVLKLADGGFVWQQVEQPSEKVQLQYMVDADWQNIILTHDSTQSFGMVALESLTFLIFNAFLYRKILSFHGAMVDAEGRGIIVSAPSGVGKTTHSRLWRDYKNALIINGDRSACYCKGEEWYGFGTPWCGTSGESINREVPIKALVLLRQSGNNRITPLNGVSLLREIMPNVVYANWDFSAFQLVTELLDGFLKKVPVVLLECTPDKEAVDVVYDYLEGMK